MDEKVNALQPVHASIERIVESRVFLHSHLEVGWAAYWIVEKSRPIGFGYGRIPLSEIAAFAALYGYDPGSVELE